MDTYVSTVWPWCWPFWGPAAASDVPQSEVIENLHQGVHAVPPVLVQALAGRGGAGPAGGREGCSGQPWRADRPWAGGQGQRISVAELGPK